MLILTAVTIILSAILSHGKVVSVIEIIISKFYEGFVPIMICYYSCLDDKYISYIFNCGKKEEIVVISEMEKQSQTEILINDNMDTYIE